MTIKSEVYNGKIYAGDTQLSSTLEVEQTGAMQLTVKSGTFTNTGGTQWTLDADVVFDLVADENCPTNVKIEIGDVEPDGILDVWCGTCVQDGIEEFDVPEGWIAGHPLVYNFSIPSGCTDLTQIDIYALTVLDGFPDGTTAEDWKTQKGAS